MKASWDTPPADHTYVWITFKMGRGDEGKNILHKQNLNIAFIEVIIKSMSTRAQQSQENAN